ncbi:sodium:solute symporter family protein [Ferrimonas futtsuensis]|uniref:sodium:solute symporter family protein n=1 Tax=Ferrimonas futtsuensis TaxID=364764 RepID=UPI0006876FC3|nr:sodium:solute symporter family protein [Ferrimonas futtsuensis]
MHTIDYLLFFGYLMALLAVGLYYYRRHRGGEDYYLAGRNLPAKHVGFSIAATDVGGGFSIGLAGLGFTMGLSASWLLFTGLLGAWLTAVLLIPKVKRRDQTQNLFTYPDLLRHHFGPRVAMIAALISGVGYLGFTSAQLLAGAKLASVTLIPDSLSFDSPLTLALWIIGGTTILYTAFGGLKAVIMTDSIQWLVLLLGLLCLALPMAWSQVGGWSGLNATLPEHFFSLSSISGITLINWMVTITPIWFVAMTLYQRIYACRDDATAKRAWFMAGLLEYPVMAFSGVLLGMCARVLLPEMDAESAVPAMIRDLLPVGVTGLVVAAYFSAIMSTADSCLMACSGNLLNDLMGLRDNDRYTVRYSMLATLILGVIAIILAARAESVLSAILMAYTLMISGLVMPTLACLFWPRVSQGTALASMLTGCITSLWLMWPPLPVPELIQASGLDAGVFGLTASACAMGIAHMMNCIFSTSHSQKELHD